MPKHLYTCLLVAACLATGNGYAQVRKVDSLLALLATAKDTARVNVLNQVASSYWYADPAKTFDYARQAASLAEEIQFTRGLAIKKSGNLQQDTIG